MSSISDTEALEGICPHLGLADDAESHATYATEAHRCYRMERPTKIASNHQERFCLGPDHQTCPIFRGEGVAATTPATAATGATAAAPRTRPETAGLDRPRAANRPQPERPLKAGTLGPRPRPGGMSMRTMTIGLFALALVVVVLAFAIMRIAGSGGDGGPTQAEVASTRTAQAKTPTVAANATVATPRPGTPGTVATASGTPGTPRPTVTGTAGTGSKTYKVKSGDNCGSIASDHNTTFEELRRLNPEINTECSNLAIDQVIKLP